MLMKPPLGVAATRVLDLDDVGAPVGQDRPAAGTKVNWATSGRGRLHRLRNTGVLSNGPPSCGMPDGLDLEVFPESLVTVTPAEATLFVPPTGW